MRGTIRSRRIRLVAFVATVSALLVVAVAAAQPVVNGDFETGDLTGWTTFTTFNGTIGTPAVVSFDTTGTGASNAARFQVGTVVSLFVSAGGGIFQNVSTASGVFDLSADIAAHNQSLLDHLDCGLFELLVDGAVVASHDFLDCAAMVTERATLSAAGLPLAAGPHEVRIRMTRPAGVDPAISSLQYVDNVELVGPPTFAGTPGNANCFGKSVSALNHEFGNQPAAAAALGFASVDAMHVAITDFCSS
jgi:hypothetical protein